MLVELCKQNLPVNIVGYLLFCFQELRDDMPSILADVFSILGKLIFFFWLIYLRLAYYTEIMVL